jgi:hypothetical protein
MQANVLMKMKLAVLICMLSMLLIIDAFSSHIARTCAMTNFSSDDEKRYIFQEDFDAIPPNGYTPPQCPENWEIEWSGAGQCLAQMKTYSFGTGGGSALNMSATPVNMSATPVKPQTINRTTFILSRWFDSTYIGSYGKIGFCVALNVTKKGSGVCSIVGLVPEGWYKTYAQYGVSDWPFCVTFASDKIKFQNETMMDFFIDKGYTIEVIIDLHGRKWEFDSLDASMHAIDTVRREGNFSKEVPISSDYSHYFSTDFVLGFDGVDVNVLFDRVEFFYLLPSVAVSLWDQPLFPLTLTASSIAFLTSFLLFISIRRLRMLSRRMLAISTDKQQFLTCKNPACNFQDVPADSSYCPFCGKLVSRE